MKIMLTSQEVNQILNKHICTMLSIDGTGHLTDNGEFCFGCDANHVLYLDEPEVEEEEKAEGIVDKVTDALYSAVSPIIAKDEPKEEHKEEPARSLFSKLKKPEN